MIPELNRLDLFVVLGALATALWLYVRNSRRSTLPYPPGPRKLPILGNLLDIPTSLEWETYVRWGKEYNSDIIHLKAAGKDIIVLNSLSAAVELLEKRSSIYSSRPHFTMANELMGWDWFMVMMPYGELWKERRRAFTRYFQNGSNIAVYRGLHVEFVRKLLVRLLDSPEDFIEINKHTIGEMALSLGYGVPIRPKNDPFLGLVEPAIASVTGAVLPGAFLVDIIPILKYVPEFFPGADFQKKAREWRKLQEDTREVLHKETVQLMASGTFKPSFTSTSLQNLDESADIRHQERVIQDAAALVFAGAADGTLAAILTFFVAMLYFPEVQKRAQEELDRVLEGRLPEFSDEEELPYISAVVREVSRWKPVTPNSVPHCATEDDIYRGYFIPKGSIIIPNAWAMLHNEDEYPDPSIFKPERFMKDGKINPAVRNPAVMAFGFGRRRCPGSQVAISYLWMTVASILSTFEISKALDDQGRPIEPSLLYHTTLTSRPLPFKCILKARSRAAEQLVRMTEEPC
ncbi:hypothetical protein GALMADRAFT_876216 [Galerina marginata CBS 339.88]|uniref:Cytochrome P450 n=1 Tax=Galerina marginata (strain CBS 339.88) TaxID=685588 RepID=A0A067TJ35_GALM3|nr:hypothetical protein GALMADRAFT_876216 [Galerina marginata CBS 339.88]